MSTSNVDMCLRSMQLSQSQLPPMRPVPQSKPNQQTARWRCVQSDVGNDETRITESRWVYFMQHGRPELINDRSVQVDTNATKDPLDSAFEEEQVMYFREDVMLPKRRIVL